MMLSGKINSVSGHDGQEPELIVICPRCWHEEFGDA